jgi:multidrug efflux system membrane fusion protein
MLRVLLIGLLAVAGAAGYAWYVAPPPKAKVTAAPAPVTVSTTPALKRDVPVLLSGIGTVQALNMVQLRSRVDGTLDQVNFQEGQQV